MPFFIGDTVVDSSGQLFFDRYTTNAISENVSNSIENIANTENVIQLGNILLDGEFSLAAGHGLWALSDTAGDGFLYVYNSHTDEQNFECFSNAAGNVVFSNSTGNDLGSHEPLIANGRIYGGDYFGGTVSHSTGEGYLWNFYLDGRVVERSTGSNPHGSQLEFADSGYVGKRMGGNCNILAVSDGRGTYKDVRVVSGRYDRLVQVRSDLSYTQYWPHFKLVPPKDDNTSTEVDLTLGNQGSQQFDEDFASAAIRVGHGRIYVVGEDVGQVHLYDLSGGLINSIQPPWGEAVVAANTGDFWGSAGAGYYDLDPATVLASNRDYFAVGAPYKGLGYQIPGQVWLYDCNGHLINEITPNTSGWSEYDEYGRYLAMTNEHIFVVREAKYANGQPDYDQYKIYVWDMQGNEVDDFVYHTQGDFATGNDHNVRGLCASDDILYLLAQPESTSANDYVAKYQTPKTANSYWNHVLDLTGMP